MSQPLLCTLAVMPSKMINDDDDDCDDDDDDDDDDKFCEPEIVYLSSDALEKQRTL